MLKRLSRRHFDYALLAGLLVLLIALWFSRTTPRWQSFYSSSSVRAKAQLGLFGFSEDDRFIYTHTEDQSLGKVKLMMYIQQWDARTGKLLQDVPIQIPAEDRALLVSPVGLMDDGYFVSPIRDLQYFMISHALGKQAKQHVFRHYRMDGTPVGQAITLDKQRSLLLLGEQPAGQHWAVSRAYQNVKMEATTTELIDLDTGKTICQYPTRPEEWLRDIYSLPGGRYQLLLHWSNKNGKEEQHVELVETTTGVSHARFTSPADIIIAIFPLDETHVAINAGNRQGQSFVTSIHIYRFDPEARTLQPDPTHPLNGKISEPGQMLLANKHFLEKYSFNELANTTSLLQTMRDWLSRILALRSNTRSGNIQLLDQRTSQPLSVLNHVNIYPISHSHDDLSCVQLIPNSEGVSVGLQVYTFPSPFRISLLAWMQRAAWALMLVWPLRFVIRTRRVSEAAPKYTFP